jgi:hypothetical protein
VLKGKDAKRFIDQDKRPTDEKHQEHLKECLETYKKNPIK